MAQIGVDYCNQYCIRGFFTCQSSATVRFPEQEAAEAAAALRARPELVEVLRWHTAAQAAFVNNTLAFKIKSARSKGS